MYSDPDEDCQIFYEIGAYMKNLTKLIYTRDIINTIALVKTLKESLNKALKTPVITVDDMSYDNLKYDYKFDDGMLLMLQQHDSVTEALIAIPISKRLICNGDKNLQCKLIEAELNKEYSYITTVFPVVGDNYITVKFLA